MSEQKLTLMQKFKSLPSGARTGIIGGAAVIAMLAIGTALDSENSGPKTPKPGVQKDALTVFNPGSSTATEAVAANQEAGNKRVQELEAKVALMQEQAKQGAGQSADGHWSEISNLVAQVQALQERVNSAGDKGTAPQPAPKDNGVLGKLLPQVSDLSKTYLGNNAGSGAAPQTATGSNDAGQGVAPTLPSAPVTSIQIVGDIKKPSAKAGKKDDPPAYIPSGSNFEAVLMNGMDASTAIGANRNPTPALLRIKSDAILPNLFSFNVRECFVMVGGYGNMSSERVEMRTETMSCIDESGKVWEGKVEGFLVGEDGKAGARGRVVSKQGAVLAKSFMAGFAGGLGSAFTPQPVQSLNLGGGSQQSFQMPSVDQVAGSGIAKGLNQSSQALSQFYIRLAEQMFPIVELDAGRKMTIILLKGVDLKQEK